MIITLKVRLEDDGDFDDPFYANMTLNERWTYYLKDVFASELVVIKDVEVISQE